MGFLGLVFLIYGLGLDQLALACLGLVFLAADINNNDRS